MPSFEIMYSEEEDVLEVVFETIDEAFSRTIPLNDSVTVFTDTQVTAAWGITFENYSRLLQVSETELDGLAQFSDENRLKVLQALARPPASLFLEILDAAALRALVKSPGLDRLVGSSA